MGASVGLPHLFLRDGPTFRCCMQCNGMAKGYNEMVHEQGCRLIRGREWELPADWRRRLDDANDPRLAR